MWLTGLCETLLRLMVPGCYFQLKYFNNMVFNLKAKKNLQWLLLAFGFFILLSLPPGKVVFSTDGKNARLVVDGLRAQHRKLATNSAINIKPPVYVGGLPPLKRQVNN